MEGAAADALHDAFVGLIDPGFAWIPQDTEVAQVLELALDDAGVGAIVLPSLFEDELLANRIATADAGRSETS